jgi:hypothetical protein
MDRANEDQIGQRGTGQQITIAAMGHSMRVYITRSIRVAISLQPEAQSANQFPWITLSRSALYKEGQVFLPKVK